MRPSRVLAWTRVLALLGAAQAVAFDQKLGGRRRESDLPLGRLKR
jgi:hypothetical protein